MIPWLHRRLRSSLRGDASVHTPLLTTAEIAQLAAQGRELAPPRQRMVDSRRAGDWPAARLGAGLDFEALRPYAAGDDIRRMDWRSTARGGRAYVRLYREERQAALHLVIDRGPAMRFGTRRRLKAAQGARVAVLLAFAAIAAREGVGATLWEESDVQLPAQDGAHAAQALALAAARPCPPVDATDGAERYAARLARLAAHLPGGSRLTLVSDFTWLEPAHWRPLARLADQCELCCVGVVDPAERRLPDLGMALFHDLHSGRLSWLDTRRAAAPLAEAYAQREAELSARLQSLGARYLRIGSEEDDLLPQFAHHAQSAY